MGGYKVQGKDAAAAQKLIDDAKALEAAGVFGVVLECVPAALAKIITGEIKIPTIVIGAGSDCDGQVLVINDMLGIFPGHVAKFVKQFANLSPLIGDALNQYKAEVEAGTFPAPEHAYAISDEVLNKLY
jgi:3-methyl-2-oxobutanoate hydroxymethyltransferase